MEKRALLAVILSFVVLFFYSQYFMPKPTPESMRIHDEQAVEPGQQIVNGAEPGVLDKAAADKAAADKPVSSTDDIVGEHYRRESCASASR